MRERDVETTCPTSWPRALVPAPSSFNLLASAVAALRTTSVTILGVYARVRSKPQEFVRHSGVIIDLKEFPVDNRPDLDRPRYPTCSQQVPFHLRRNDTSPEGVSNVQIY